MCPTDHHVVERRCKPLQNQHSPMKNPAEHRNSREKHSGLPPEKIPQHTSLISSSSKSPTTVTSSQKVLVNGSTSLASLGLLTPDQQKWLFSDKPPSSPTSSSSISSTADHHHGSSTGHHPHQVGHIYGGGAPHISTFAPAGHHQNTADSSIIHNNSASSHLSTRGGSVFPPGGIKMMSPGLLGKEEILLSATAGPGDSCANGACIGGSVCRHGICVCAPGEVIVGRRCVDSDGQALQVTYYLLL